MTVRCLALEKQKVVFNDDNDKEDVTGGNTTA